MVGHVFIIDDCMEIFENLLPKKPPAQLQINFTEIFCLGQIPSHIVWQTVARQVFTWWLYGKFGKSSSPQKTPGQVSKLFHRNLVDLYHIYLNYVGLKNFNTCKILKTGLTLSHWPMFFFFFGSLNNRTMSTMVLRWAIKGHHDLFVYCFIIFFIYVTIIFFALTNSNVETKF